MLRKTKLTRIMAVASLGVAVAGTANAAFVSVDQLLQYGSVQYGDALSVSLPFSAYVYDQFKGGGTGPGNPYYITSTPGAIKDLVVIATGSSGKPVTTNFPGMDNAYPTPNSSGIPFFSTGTVADPGGAGQFAGDYGYTWDATLAALNTFLDGDAPVFYFNNNQENSGGAFNQSLAAWARIWVTTGDTIVDGVVVPGTIVGDWLFTNNLSPYALVTEGGGGTVVLAPGDFDPAWENNGGETAPIADQNGLTDYVLSGGQICLEGSLATGFTPKSCTGASGEIRFNHNLGANQAAYAIVFPEFNALLASLIDTNVDLSNYYFHGDVRLGCDPLTPIALCGPNAELNQYGRSLNNGYEQIFMRGVTVENVVPVPEPGSLALLGIGLLSGLLFTRRRNG